MASDRWTMQSFGLALAERIALAASPVETTAEEMRTDMRRICEKAIEDLDGQCDHMEHAIGSGGLRGRLDEHPYDKWEPCPKGDTP